ncbi:MAG TPA: CHAT domain-containing protein [Candidatus Limnocylindrales bacterium]|jgi:CHAT domain-containing protein|nr:CHAT domain-containing protein [Candidatus Limnocylindrales bacterium]
MTLELLAMSDTAVVATGTPAIQAIRLYHREANRWVSATVPAKGSVWDKLQEADGQIDRTMQEMLNPNASGYLAAFRLIAKPLYDSIFSPELNEIVQAAAVPEADGSPPTLRLHLGSGLDIVPWELLHDGTDFLGLRFQISRLPMVSGGPAASNGQPVPVNRVVSILAKNLVAAPLRDTWQHTFDGSVKNGTTVICQPTDGHDDFADIQTLQNTGNGIGDVIHLTCHGIQNGTRRYWTLDHTQGEKILWTILPTQGDMTFAIHDNAPLVFANACASAVGVGGGGAAAGWFNALGEGFGWSFYDGGARAFIGTFAPVTDRVAISFAKRFFETALGQQRSVGQSLLETKQAYRAENEPDPSWLFYCLYGDASTTFAPV